VGHALNNLYQDIRGFLHYCWGYEFEEGFGPDIETHLSLESLPEVETMHTVTGYDS
jgi:hypothetical protein